MSFTAAKQQVATLTVCTALAAALFVMSRKAAQEAKVARALQGEVRRLELELENALAASRALPAATTFTKEELAAAAAKPDEEIDMDDEVAPNTASKPIVVEKAGATGKNAVDKDHFIKFLRYQIRELELAALEVGQEIQVLSQNIPKSAGGQEAQARFLEHEASAKWQAAIQKHQDAGLRFFQFSEQGLKQFAESADFQDPAVQEAYEQHQGLVHEQRVAATIPDFVTAKWLAQFLREGMQDTMHVSEMAIRKIQFEAGGKDETLAHAEAQVALESVDAEITKQMQPVERKAFQKHGLANLPSRPETIIQLAQMGFMQSDPWFEAEFEKIQEEKAVLMQGLTQSSNLFLQKKTAAAKKKGAKGSKKK
jgi:hypothetical protein